MKRVVVTGATGFIGQALVAALVARGDGVIALTRSASRPPAREDDVAYEHWNPTLEVPLAGVVLDSADAVVHLAGERAVGVRWTEAVKRAIYDSRILSTERLVRAIENAPRRPRVFVCASGVGYYGAHGDELLEEGAPQGDDFLADVTANWERAAMRAEVFGVRVVCARFGVVLGANGGALAEMVKPFKLFVGGPIGSGEQFVSWVHVADAALAILLAIDDDRLRGPVNVVAPNPVTNRELSAHIGRVLHRPSFLPVPALALALRFGEGARPIVTGQRVHPAALERVGYSFRYPRAEEAVKAALR